MIENSPNEIYQDINRGYDIAQELIQKSQN